jgi:hypothetical protein
MRDYVINPQLPRNGRGPVGAAIVDHKSANFVDPGQRAWDTLHYERQRTLLIVARDLDEKLHPGALKSRRGPPARQASDAVAKLADVLGLAAGERFGPDR